MNRFKIFIALLLLFCNIPQSDSWAQNTISLLSRALDKVEQGTSKVVGQVFKEKQVEAPVPEANQQSATEKDAGGDAGLSGANQERQMHRLG